MPPLHRQTHRHTRGARARTPYRSPPPTTGARGKRNDPSAELCSTHSVTVAARRPLHVRFGRARHTHARHRRTRTFARDRHDLNFTIVVSIQYQITAETVYIGGGGGGDNDDDHPAPSNDNNIVKIVFCRPVAVGRTRHNRPVAAICDVTSQQTHVRPCARVSSASKQYSRTACICGVIVLFPLYLCGGKRKKKSSLVVTHRRYAAVAVQPRLPTSTRRSWRRRRRYRRPSLRRPQPQRSLSVRRCSNRTTTCRSPIAVFPRLLDVHK
ncbi:hypothetical protein AGLY_001456 [Aphis glycines]|uniref:Uncharacterized protein n=1 Tax=Aphis glycines TaxID=307491 RepID=A0A6G0U5P9_APHGL|nr:hypothetical protein AGLY_001456 [Aphis glycines]